MGGTYAFVRAASANLRQVEDPWNTAVAGFSAGALLGLRGRSPTIANDILASLHAIEYTNPTLVQLALSPLSWATAPLPLPPWPLSITPKDCTDTPRTTMRMSSSAARSCARTSRLLPSKPLRNWARDAVREILPFVIPATLGITPNRMKTNSHVIILGITGPNYEERRRERIKETYGIEVPTSPVPAS